MLSNNRHQFFRAAGLHHHRIVNRSISHPALRFGSIQYLRRGYSGRHNGQRERHYTKHDMAPNLPHCRSMLGFMHETLPTLPLRLFAPNPPDSLPPGVSLSSFRGSASIHPGLTASGTVHTATTYTQDVTVIVRMEPKESPTVT